MCGFAGLITPPVSVSSPQDALRAMTATLEHRGPDADGHFEDLASGVFMGFRRLAILDLSDAGNQPMASDDGRFVMTFNGEIYNFRDLRGILERQGVVFSSHSDTEVLLRAIEHWGLRATIPRLVGMFAIALWDRAERELWLVRDRMGIKPLYVLESGGSLAYASEARAFHKCPLYDGAGDANAAHGFLRRLHVSGPLSILSGVTRLRPGEFIRYRVLGGTTRRIERGLYWSLSEVASAGLRNRNWSGEEAVDTLHELIRDAVSLRLVADVPVGGFLSGGIDSTTIVAVMQELSTERVKTFTVGFDHPDFNESHSASAIAEHLGTDHTTIAFADSEVRNVIPSLPALSDEPMANPSLLPTLLVSRVARGQVVVALSGDGGDELFGGYNRYGRGAQLIRTVERWPTGVRGLLGSALARSTEMTTLMRFLEGRQPVGVSRQHSLPERLRKMARVLAATDRSGAYAALMEVGLAHPPVRRPAAGPAGVEALGSGMELEDWMMLHDQMHYLPEDLLAKVDRASMWESLEARVPLLDHRIVEFSWHIPPEMKMRDHQMKWPLRQVAHRYVPAGLLDGPKMGFTVPIAEWLRTELRPWARDTLSSQRAREGGLWDMPRLERLWKEFDGGRYDLALAIWTAAVLQNWTDHWNVRFS